MKIQVASDLHLEHLRGFRKTHPGYRIIEAAADADVLVLAGDIDSKTDATRVFADWPVPIVYICGNHEFYGSVMLSVRDQLFARTPYGSAPVHYLENSEIIIGGTRFLGCTLWTDYELYGSEPAQIEAAMRSAQRFLYDHEAIRVGAREKFVPEHALLYHRASRHWLEEKLSEKFEGPTVVVTHHGPSIHSMHESFDGDALNPAYMSNLESLMGDRVTLWIHGHVHNSVQYEINGTRVVTNPCGYPKNLHNVSRPEDILFENADFKRDFVIEI